MKNLYKFIIIFLLFLLFLIIFIGYLFLNSYDNINEIKDYLLVQESIDKRINNYDYDFDNMNVILNPYKVSPLTALINFNTEEYCKIEVTIKGKYNDDLKYYYNEEKSHYLIIYGLYADYDNEVIIKCNNKIKNIIIKTNSIPNIERIDNNNINDLNFYSSNYLYAVDKNNEIRWVLNDINNGDISILENNHLIVSTNRYNSDNSYTGIDEIDLLGKVYYEYEIDYEGKNNIRKNNIYVYNTNNSYIIDRQTGEIKKNKEDYNKENNTLNNDNINFKVKKGVRFNNDKETKLSNKNITLLNYKKIDKNYKNYNIRIIKEFDRLSISGNFDNKDNYLILDKLFDKRVYKLNKKNTYINKLDLEGEYNIYLKLNNKLYKTNKSVTFN